MHNSYDNMPEKTCAAQINLPDGSVWFNTTDLGYFNEDGFVYVTGRTTRVVIRTDHKVSLDYLEEKIRGIDGVLEAAVITPTDSDSILAFISPRDGRNGVQLEKNIRNSGDFSMWDTPDKIYIMEELPYMKNGKIDYTALDVIAREKQ